MSREVALHIWPLVQKQPKRAHSAAVCIIYTNGDSEKDCLKLNIMKKNLSRGFSTALHQFLFSPLTFKQRLIKCTFNSFRVQTSNGTKREKTWTSLKYVRARQNNLLLGSFIPLSRSTSSNTTIGLFPPSSSVTGCSKRDLSKDISNSSWLEH